MLTLKIIEPEGDFDINMPLGAPAESAVTDAELPPFKVRLEAEDADEADALAGAGACCAPALEPSASTQASSACCAPEAGRG